MPANCQQNNYRQWRIRQQDDKSAAAGSNKNGFKAVTIRFQGSDNTAAWQWQNSRSLLVRMVASKQQADRWQGERLQQAGNRKRWISVPAWDRNPPLRFSPAGWGRGAGGWTPRGLPLIISRDCPGCCASVRASSCGWRPTWRSSPPVRRPIWSLCAISCPSPCSRWPYPAPRRRWP